MAEAPVGVLLMTFGTARSLDEVPAYLSSVRGGREVPQELIAEFQRRFEQVGGSPLIEITREQAEGLQGRLNRDRGRPFLVRSGMRHSEPTIRSGLLELQQAGADPIIGVVLSPQFSDRIMGGYVTAVAAAEADLKLPRPVRVARDWHLSPWFVAGLAERLQDRIDDLSAEILARTAIVFTAHSLPRSVADGEPEYLKALQATADAVAAKAGLAADRWFFSYQSAGHTREEWLKPDITDLFPMLQEKGLTAVIVVPVQFLSDHLEVLYDIDVAANEQAEAAGMQLFRIESLNTSPWLIESLATVVLAELQAIEG